MTASRPREVRADQHGTLTGYTYGCRCGECRTANAYYVRARRKRGLPADSDKHGTVTGYSSHGCRCEDCCDAYSDWQGARMRAAKQGAAS